MSISRYGISLILWNVAKPRKNLDLGRCASTSVFDLC